MPYKDNSQLPDAVKVLPSSAQSLFREVFNKVYATNKTESRAFRIAWGAVKRRFKKVDDKWVAKSTAFIPMHYYTFTATPAEQFTSRSAEGNIIQRYILSDIWPDEYGTAPSPELLDAFAKQAVGKEVDTDHELWNHALNQLGMKTEFLPDNEQSAEFIDTFMSQKRGIGRIIDAVIEAGRLVVSILFDKRYSKFIDLIKGLSIEAGVITDPETKQWRDGRLFGATFAVNSDPVNPRATRFIA